MEMKRILIGAALALSLGCKSHPTPPPDQPPPPVVTLPDAGERGRLHIEQQNGVMAFTREDGSIYPWIGASEFLLYKRHLDGENIRPVVEEMVGAGANLVRVMGMASQGLRVADYPAYYDQLLPFADLLAEYHVRLEFTIFAEAEATMPFESQQDQHVDRVVEILAQAWNTVGEINNEPMIWSNMPGGEPRAAALARRAQGKGLLISSGAYSGMNPGERDLPTGDLATARMRDRTADFGTTHTPRDDQWIRKAKDLRELRDMTGVPWVGDEPIGAGEADIPGKRTTNCEGYAQYMALAQQQGAGSTFHSQDGLNAQLLGETQKRCAVQAFAAAKWMPPAAQTWGYNRGGGTPGCHWLGESLVEHDDSIELRSFGAVSGDFGWIVQAGTQREHAAACSPWQIAEEFSRGIIRVMR